uniref:Thaumatin-like protein n=1 Tax=Ananas comosus var. bracteatus TaxID=296719 RepID=A0A6V7P3P2_ANACO|nr:unnamed protein product [Ananas comosus var. bracteatus]
METETSYSMLFSFVSIFVLMFQPSMCSTSFTVSNNCPQTIWPGTLAGAGTPQLPTTGFRLDSGQTVRILAPPGWSGRIWARTGCEFDSDGAGICQTGDCGGRMECGGAGALPPTTLFEITLGKGTDEDYYDVSLVDGYNLPVVIVPRVQHGRCNATGCITDLNRGCPRELQVECGTGWWRARARARRSVSTSTAAAEILRTPVLASHPSTRRSSKLRAREPTAMLSMTEPALSPARPMTTPLSSVLQLLAAL